jgi:hypothetical protein
MSWTAVAAGASPAEAPAAAAVDCGLACSRKLAVAAGYYRARHAIGMHAIALANLASESILTRV